MDKLTTRNVKGVAHSTEPTESHHLRFSAHCFGLIACDFTHCTAASFQSINTDKRIACCTKGTQMLPLTGVRNAAFDR